MLSAINKKATLSQRLTRSYGAMFLLVLILLSLAVFALAGGFLIQRQRDTLLTSSELIADHIVEELHEGNAITKKAMMDEQNLYADLNLYLLDDSGLILNQLVNFHLDTSLLKKSAFSPELRLSADYELLLCYEQPVIDENTTICTLYAVLQMENEKDFLEMLALLLIGANVLGVFAALMVGRKTGCRILKPIGSMIAAANAIGSESLEARLDVPEEDDELRSLALTVNTMLDRIQAAFEAQGRFVADASHELRTPLAILQGNADMLSRWGTKDEKVLNESIASIQRQTGYMNKLVENLLFLARSDGKRQQFSMSEFAVKDMLGELTEEQEMLDDSHEYRMNCADDICLNADRNMVRQLLHAAIDNSVKYTPAGGSITLSARQDGQNVYLSVADTGMGMDSEHLKHIFERFYRADKARARSTGGLGLGLSIAAAIAAAHGGSIYAESKTERGTTITAVFPKITK